MNTTSVATQPKLTLYASVRRIYDGTCTLIQIYAVRPAYEVDPLFAQHKNQYVEQEDTLIAQKKLWGNYSQAQSEREWKMNRRTFVFVQTDKAKVLAKQI
jgi:hypothetical protein